jgi:hypothetical protein
MKNDDSVQKEVRKTMEFLDKMPKLESNPFLFTRIRAQLDDGVLDRRSPEGSRLSTVLRSTLIVVLVVLNFITIITSIQSTTSKTIDRKEALSNLIDDYSMTDSSTSPTE